MASPESFSARRINHLIQNLDAKNYLEIGVCKGATFFEVQAQRKVAVDPAFQFDEQKHATEAAIFHRCTSDTYFLERAGAERFDFVFVDGLHTFEQTFRDFCNSVVHAHDSTLWLIDDILPNDAYSALPEYNDTIRFRHEAGQAGYAWHGDTFKVMFAIHDFFPTLSYCSIATGGNPQALVWKQPRAAFRPVLNSLEAISRLSYFDLRKRLDVLRLLPEDEALAQALAGVASRCGVAAGT